MKNKIGKNYSYYVFYLKSKRIFDDKVLEFPSAMELEVWRLNLWLVYFSGLGVWSLYLKRVSLFD